MTFWLVFFGLLALALAVMILALMHFHKGAAQFPKKPVQKSADLDVYKAQLRELAADEKNTLLSAEDMASARLEIERRILHASEEISAKSKAQGETLSTGLIVTFMTAILIGVSLLYFTIGMPGMADKPFVAKSQQIQPSAQRQRAQDSVARIKVKLQEDEKDKTGWVALGYYEQQLGNAAASVKAYEKAYSLSPENMDTAVSYGESLVFFSEGRVSPAALTIFRKVLRDQASHPAARYYLALADYQAGDIQEAYGQWQAIAAHSPADAPYLPHVHSWIARAENDLGIVTEASVAPQISEAQKAQVMALSEEDRAELIRSMIARLADKQQENPQNIEGWLRLGKAYQMIGEKDKALESLNRAFKHASETEKSQIKKQLENLQKAE